MGNFGIGMQRLIDAHQNFLRAAHPVYLRTRNFVAPQSTDYSEIGFSIRPGTAAATGVTDTLIAPPPGVRMVSMHNIAASAGKLRFGARIYTVSASFVDAQSDFHDAGAQMAFWRSPAVMGLVSENILFSVEDIAHEELAGKTLMWMITCNANELR